MKKFSIFLLALSLFAACTNEITEDLSLFIPGALKISFDSQSRVELDQNCQTVWTKGDEVGVFYDYYPTLYEYYGETGAKEGILVPKEQVPDTSGEIIVVYPYYVLNTHSQSAQQIRGVIIPTTQYYKDSSYGVGASIMVGVGTSENIQLKSICGWIKLQFTGSEKLTKITLRGNNNEHIAGEIAVNYRDLTSEFANEWDAETKITLDLGEGVQLSETPTDFYISLLPQTFTKGITVTAIAENGTQIHQTTDKQITICRNVIQPMKSVEYEDVLDNIDPTQIPDNEVWYTTTDGKIINPYYKSNINIVSNKYENGKGVIRFDDTLTNITDYYFSSCFNLANIILPDSVITIGNYAFEDCSGLKSVTIPGSVTAIGNNAFDNCFNLVNVIIPDSVITIGDEAFRFCSSLASVTIGNNVTTIGEHAFWMCSNLTNITIPDSVTTIGNSAFADCSSLADVTIGNGVTTIENGAFSSCDNLINITIPDSVKSIGINPFNNCPNLAEFRGKFASKDGRCLIVSGVLNSFAPAGCTEYSIPNSVTTIGDFAFSSCGNLIKITIPDSVTVVGDSAFYDCNNLITINIPDSVITIGDAVFCRCSSLASVEIPNSVKTIEDSAFAYCDSLTSATLGSGITTIENYLFAWCPNLTSITIPDNVTTINTYAFYFCEGLTSVTIPDSITSIGYGAFLDCYCLTSVHITDLSAWCKINFNDWSSNPFYSHGHSDWLNTEELYLYLNGEKVTDLVIPNDITVIKQYTFYNYCSLASVVIPDSVTTIEKCAFWGCNNIASIYCKRTTPPAVGENVFSIGNSLKIYVPRASVDAYKSADGWKEYADAIEPYDF